jgi:hypothetical protein
MIGQIPIVHDNGNEMYFDENDIRHACGIMVCGDHAEECIVLMKTRNIECALCYSVLLAKKKPFRAKRIVTAKKRVSR